MIEALKEFIDSPSQSSIDTDTFYIMINRRGFIIHVEKQEIKNPSSFMPECSDLILGYFLKFAEQYKKTELKKPSALKYIDCEGIIYSIQFSLERISWIALPTTKPTLEEKTMSFVLSGGENGKSKSEITKLLHNYPSDVRKKTIENLIFTGQIVKKTVCVCSNYPRTYYYAINNG